jgi:hypothetical protein
MRQEERSMASSDTDSGNAINLVLAWAFVGIPLAWGVIETLTNALKLFQ